MAYWSFEALQKGAEEHYPKSDDHELIERVMHYVPT